ncbi:MAG: hypothetical protein IH865_13910 [Chloroflexi bacterium]|nr:hypothetical protein [Chloroflexota bacterium]
MSQQLTPEYGDIDALLRASAKAFSYPATPNVIAASVRTRLEDEASFVERLRAVLARPVLRAGAAVLLVAAVVVASALVVPQSREALADFFGLSSVKIEIGPLLGPPPPVLSPDSFASPATLQTAQEAVEFEIRLPTERGVQMLPDAVYVEDIGGTSPPVVILVYESEDFDLYQRSMGFYGKGLPYAELARESSVHGRPAIWIGSGGHIARSLDADGNLLIETERTVKRRTLLWEDGGISYRLETGLSEEEAILLAESLR